MDLEINVNAIDYVVIDHNGLPEEHHPEGEQWGNFIEIVKLLAGRDFKVFLLSDTAADEPAWGGNKNIIPLKISKDSPDTIFQNQRLFEKNGFWVTDNQVTQNHLVKQQIPFATECEHQATPHVFRYLKFQDIVRLLDPSRYTAFKVAQQILESKSQSTDQAFSVCVGGPEDCGHDYFIEALIDELEAGDYVIQGLDLSALLGTEFHKNPMPYWKSKEAYDWIFQNILLPFNQGKRIFIEEPPAVLAEHAEGIFPLFLTPEMILVLWGSSIFLPEFQEINDWNILLELSPKAATARLYGIDDREDFDPDFIKQYQQKDGKLYNDYLKQNDVVDAITTFINFDNFNAFRFKNIIHVT